MRSRTEDQAARSVRARGAFFATAFGRPWPEAGEAGYASWWDSPADGLAPTE